MKQSSEATFGVHALRTMTTSRLFSPAISMIVLVSITSLAALSSFWVVRRLAPPRSPVPTVWERPQVAVVDTFGVGNLAEKDRADYLAIERKFDLLDAFTRASGYVGHEGYSDRMWGIASLHLYAQAKTQFVFRTLRKHFSKAAVPPTICELGFNAGHSALLMLEALPDAKLVSFDLGDADWADANQKLLAFMYAPRFRYIKGDSAETVRAAADLKCDAFFIDGSKSTEARYADVLNFRSLSRPGAILFMDEVSSEACARGTMSETDCIATTGSYAPTTIAYNRLSKEGTISVDACVTTPTIGDAFCCATFT